MRCSACNHDNRDAARFCEECAAPIRHVCASCGSELRPTAKFCDECGASVSEPAAPPELTPAAPGPAPDAERRQLTVLFCDLVGSTELSTRLDPEDLREIVRDYQHAARAVVARFSGHIAQYLGDGLLIYFGYPEADEHDAERAVRAGLELLATVPAVQSRALAATGAPLAVRIGIHTGPVVVGDIGAGERAETLALGETPNIAARVQALAAPNMVVITSATQRLVAGLFLFEEQGARSLKGVRQPVMLYRALQPSGARGRLDAARAHGLTPFVGRKDELRLLWKGWERARAGDGQVVLVTGEAGIGKSRLGEALHTRLAGETHARWEGRCSPYHQQSALRPWIELAEQTFGFVREDSPVERFGRIAAGLTPYGLADAEMLALWASLLSIPLPEEYAPLSMTPARHKQKTVDAIVRLLLAVAAHRPVLLLVEDLHWADPSTLELLGILVDQVPTARVLLLLTARPEFRPPWGPRAHVTLSTLERLPRHHTTAMIERLTGGRSLPAPVLEQIVARTDGIPLFVEELIKTVLEASTPGEEQGRDARAGPLPPLAIPATLRDSLRARLDRLGSARAVAQLGATLGRQFSYELLRAVSPLDETTLERELSRLVEAELLYQRGLPPQATYLFKHALIQEAAYESLLKSTRSQYHQRVAVVLAEHFPEITESEPELLAQHFTAAGLIAEAIPYWQEAGQKASQRSANVEAVNHLMKGLELLKTLAQTPERAQQELALQLALGSPLQVIKGWASPEVELVYIRARELSQQVGETSQLFRALWGIWLFYYTRAECQTARTLAEQLLRIAEGAQDPTLVLEGHHALWPTLFALGELAQAQLHLDAGSALYDLQQHRAMASFYGGHDAGVCCLDFAALTLWSMGYPDQALDKDREAFALAKELAHPYSLALCLYSATRLHQLCGERQVVQECAEELIALSSEQGFPSTVQWGIIARGWAQTEAGRSEEGIAQMRRGLADYQAMGARLVCPYFLALLAEAHAKVGQFEEGLQCLTEALAQVDKTGERQYHAELHRLRGELLLQLHASRTHAGGAGQDTPPGVQVADPQAEAEACFSTAIEIARCQSAKSHELRAAMSLARLRHAQGRKVEARKMLAEVYDWFTEGFDTKDLQDALALLKELT